MKFFKKYWLIILLLTIILSLCFFWFQWRPARIRHNCSWIKQHSNLVPGISKEQAEKDNKECLVKKQEEKNIKGQYNFGLYKYMSCDEYPTQDIPAKDWWKMATPQEYSACIHSNGL